MINTGLVNSSPALTQPFTVKRNTGQFGPGGYLANDPTIIPCWGTVSVATDKELAMVPEGDRVTEAMVFHSTTQFLVTNPSGTSDVITWHGVDYRILFISDYSMTGSWKAIAVRKSGK